MALRSLRQDGGTRLASKLRESRKDIPQTDGAQVYFSGSLTEIMRSAATSRSCWTMPEGQWISTRSADGFAPKPKWTGPALDEAYPAAVDIWSYCVPLLVTTLMRAPMPSRLLLVPCSLSSSQWFAPGLSLIQISAGALIALTTTSTRPSPFRSPMADPRCRAGGREVSPASAVKAANFIRPLFVPPRLRKTVFGCATVMRGADKRDRTCPRETKMSF